MLKQDKKTLLEKLTKLKEEKNNIIIVRHKKLAFSSFDGARRSIANDDTIIKKVKNSIIKILFKNTQYEELNHNTFQEILLIFSSNLFQACEVAQFLEKNNEQVEILEGFCENEKYSSNIIKQVASIGSKKQLQSNLLHVINDVGASILRVINAKCENK